MLQLLIAYYVSEKLAPPDTEPKPEAIVHTFRIAVSRYHQMKLQLFTVKSSSASGFIHLPEPLFFARQPSRAFLCTGGTVCRHCRSIVSTMYRRYGMSTLQEHCVDDVQDVRYVDTAGALCRRCTGGTVCRHCRSINSE